jgi:quercetin dioxygenase-like cupin family protein
LSELFELGPTRLRVVVASAEATVLEGELDPGGGSAWHTHTREDETIVVLEGALVVDDGERRELGPGDACVLPRGLRHSFANESVSVTRVYFFCSPGGLERFFRELIVATRDEDVAAAATRAGLVFG